jgi:predicted DNA binding CopG/RHH family protein
MKKKLILPKFKNEDEERDFWNKLDITEYFEPSDFKPFVLSDLMKKSKPKARKITIRLPEDWITQTKEIAGKLDIPYQSLMKQFIHKGLQSSK